MARTYTVQVPHTNWNDRAADMRSRLQTWEWKWRLPRETDALEIDFTDVEFIEPWAAAMFTAYGLAVRHDPGIRVAAKLDDNRSSNRYLRLMDLDHVLSSGQSTSRWDDDSRNTGLHVVRTHDDVERFVNSAGRLGSGPNEGMIDALRYGMSEMARNVVQHSQSAVGGVAMAQYFPDRHTIQIVICDSGRGVRESLSGNYPEIATDLEALKLSLLPHVSGSVPTGPYDSSENAGLGLFFTKEIAWRAGGSFWLGSRRSLVGVTGEDLDARRRTYRSIQNWPGTVAVMDLPADLSVDFADLLGLCQAISRQARAEPGTVGLDVLAEPPDFQGMALSEIPHVVQVSEFLENVQRAATLREQDLRPRIDRGQQVFMDFGGARFVTQSFAHALLYDLFRIPGSLGKLSFFNCTRATIQALRTVAAYAATYRMRH